MNNTGLLLSRPGESYYGAYYRFVLANRSLSLKLAQIKKNSKMKNEYRLAKYAGLIEQRFCKFYGIDRFDLPKKIKNHYRPEKCCPYCFKVGYHSYVFDYQWLKYCPVHNTKLVANCPGCNNPWPAYSELILVNKCSLCGSYKGFSDLTQNHGKFTNGYKRIALIQDILEVRSKNFVADAIFGIPMLKQNYSLGDTAINNVLIFSLLKKERLISEYEYQELSKVKEISFENIETVLISVNDKETLFHLSRTRDEPIIEKERIIYDKVESYIMTSISASNKDHEICSCINDRGMCSNCLPLFLYLLFRTRSPTVYSESDLYLWDARERIKKYEHCFRGSLDQWRQFIIELGLFNFFNENERFWVGSINYISEIFLEAELMQLTSIIFNQLSDMSKSTFVSWEEYSAHTKTLLNQIKNMNIPVVLVVRDEELSLNCENNGIINLNYESK